MSHLMSEIEAQYLLKTKVILYLASISNEMEVTQGELRVQSREETSMKKNHGAPKESAKGRQGLCPRKRPRAPSTRHDPGSNALERATVLGEERSDGPRPGGPGGQ